MPATRIRVTLPEPVTVVLLAGTVLRLREDQLIDALTGSDGEVPGPQPASAPVAWLVDINPKRPFDQSQGVIPAGNGPKSGEPNLVAAQCEATVGADGADQDVAQIKLGAPSPKVSADAIEHTPGVAWVSRIRESSGPVYEHRLNKLAAAYQPGGDSIRAELGGIGNTRFSPWGTPEICVGAVWLPEDWADPAQVSSGEWNVVFQWHDAAGGLTHNPPAAVYLRAGENPKFAFTLRKYRDGLAPPEQGNQPVASESFPATVGKWHYFVAHYSADAGGDFSGATPGFFDFWHSEGDGPLEQIVKYKGLWGSPNPRTKEEPGYWKTGLYAATKFAGSDNRVVRTKGFRQYAGQRGLTPTQALADFKASRAA